MSFEYTLASKDPSKYGFIQCYFEHPGTDFASMTVTNMVAQCNILVLGVNDFIKIRDVVCYFNEDNTSMNHDTLIYLLNGLLSRYDIRGPSFSLDYCNRIILNGNGQPFRLQDASYNVRVLMGLHPFDNISVDALEYTIPTVGSMLSTPVLYLTCNIGAKCFKNVMNADNIQNTKIAMRITNSFSANYPINANNMEFFVTVASTDVSNVEFKLVDANMRDIVLLSPMYLSVSIKRIENERMFMNGNSETLKWMDIQKNKEASEYYTEMKTFEIISNMRSSEANRLLDRNLK